MPSIQDTKTLEDAAAFVRRERQRRGWTAQELAERLMEISASAGDGLSLTQQAISFFETGKTKSFPRWLRHIDLVLAAHDVEERASLVLEYDPADDEHGGDLTPDEHALLELFRTISPKDQAAIVQLARSLATCGPPPTLHDKRQAYHAGDPETGRLAPSGRADARKV